MNPADLARNNAIPLECKKDAMRQTQSGDWKITFTVQAADMDQRLTSAAMGTRFQVALVEIGDDELPKEQPKGKLDWRELQPAAQAGIRCADPVFQSYLREERSQSWVNSSATAAEYVRKFCEAKSRSELSSDHRKRVLWFQLDGMFQVWLHLERAS